MSWLLEFLSEVVWLFKETAFFLLLGFLLAGVLRTVISGSRAFRYFKGNDLKSVTAASIVGVPLPLCSCSVLPVAASLRREGASRGATASFLISTPETGVDSIATSYALLDPVLTIVRPVAAFLTAIVTGQFVNWFVHDKDEKSVEEIEAEEAADQGCHSHSHDHGDSHDHDHGHDHHDHDHDLVPQGKAGVRGTLHYSFVTLLDELGPYLVLGFLLSGLIAVLIPSEWFATPVLGGIGGMLLMLVIGIPMYVCATGSTPVAAALLLKGLNPGAAVVFLLAGPATNLGALVALRRYLGRKALIIYLLSIALMSLAIGFAVDAFYTSQGIVASAIVGTNTQVLPEFVKIACAVALLAMWVPSVGRTRFYLAWADNVRRFFRPLGFDPLSRGMRRLAIVGLLILYFSTGVSVVSPGESGWVLTFGKISREVTEPGAVLHWPYPVESVRTVQLESVRRVVCGSPDEGVGEEAEDEGEQRERRPTRWNPRRTEQDAEVVDADENLLVIRFTLQYSLVDPHAFAFRIADTEDLVRSHGEWAIRRVAASMKTDDLLVGNHAQIETEAARIVQSELDALDAGIRLEHVRVLFIHPPENVHYAFRDLASAEEEWVQRILIAEREALQIEIEAQSEAFRQKQEERMLALEKLAYETGRAEGFTARVEAWRDTKKMTQERLRYEALEALLERVRIVLDLTDDGLDLELLFDDRENGSDILEFGGRRSTSSSMDDDTH